MAGLEPARVSPPDFESDASTNFATWAAIKKYYIPKFNLQVFLLFFGIFSQLSAKMLFQPLSFVTPAKAGIPIKQILFLRPTPQAKAYFLHLNGVVRKPRFPRSRE